MATQEGLRPAAGTRRRRWTLRERLMRRARRTPLKWILPVRRISDEERERFNRNVANDREIQDAIERALAAHPQFRRKG